MALKIVDTTSLDAVAKAINESAGTSGAISFPDGFVEKIGELSGGGKLAGMLDGTITELTEKDFGNITSVLGFACYNRRLQKVTMPDTIIELQGSAFEWCDNIKSIKLSKNLKKCGNRTFSYVREMPHIDLPDSITSLGKGCFYNCWILESLRIPNGVTTIPEEFVYEGRALKVFDLTAYGQDKSLPTLANINAFTNTPADMKIIVPHGRKVTLAGMTNWSSFANQILEFDKDVGTEGVLIDYSSDGTKLVCSGWDEYAGVEISPYLVIPADYDENPILEVTADAFSGNTKIVRVYLNNVKTIGDYAFNNCTSLFSVDAPNVTQIGKYSFGKCDMESIELPELLWMATDGFVGCPNLKRANLGKINNIGNYCFTNCTAFETLILPNTQKVTTLANVNAFSNTPVAAGSGYIYVPKALIDSYKSATNWSTFASQFRAIEDYPDICGG
jgi:hypothetical protein